MTLAGWGWDGAAEGGRGGGGAVLRDQDDEEEEEEAMVRALDKEEALLTGVCAGGWERGMVFKWDKGERDTDLLTQPRPISDEEWLARVAV
jgi:hypothetical protein